MDDSDINISITYGRRDGIRSILDDIGQRYTTTRRPETAELLLDGTSYMFLKSKASASSATDLVAPLPEPSELNSLKLPEIKFEECRRCSGTFAFQLQSGGLVRILPGIPPKGTNYKAMSYVWGDVSTLKIPCKRCGQVSSVPMMNARRFKNLMELGGEGNIWLDAVSINQSNQSEVATTVTAMGRIYGDARCVSVLFPNSDIPLFDCIHEAARNAMGILEHRQNFVSNSEIEIDDPTGISPCGKLRLLTEFSRVFRECIKLVHDHGHTYTYFRRAWTFQEWALAKDIEIAVEGGTTVVSYAIKSLLLGAGMLLVRYKLCYSQYAEIQTGLSVSNAPHFLNQIKGFVPYEDLFLSYEEVDDEEASFQTNFPHFGVNQLLGLRNLPPRTSLEPRAEEQSRVRARFINLLSSFASSPHEAKYEADLVACWAGMCNFQYDYKKDDDFDTALQKVLAVLRSKGITIYHFLPDTKGRTRNTWDVFRVYAHEHPLTHNPTPSSYSGPPIFTGQADICLHMYHAVLKVAVPTEFLRSTDGLVRVVGASCVNLITLDDLDDAMGKFAKSVYGILIDSPPATIFYRAQDLAKRTLDKVAAHQRAIARLCVVRLPFSKDGSEAAGSLGLSLWSVVPADIHSDSMFVAREPMNGTLVLATRRDGKSYIVAYLTLTDHISGTSLVSTDSQGHIDLCLKLPRKTSTQNSVYLRIGDRYVRGTVPLESQP